MGKSIKTGYFKPIEDRVTLMGQNNSPKGEGVAFSFDVSKYITDYSSNTKLPEVGVIIYKNNGIEQRYAFNMSLRIGTLLGLYIENLDSSKVLYNFYVGDEIINDPNALEYTGNEKFGKVVDSSQIKSVFFTDRFDWDDDCNPRIPYEDSVFYGLNVRAFTMDRSSRVSKKGTYEGIIQKIPYLKDLGITSIVLMPSYEFDECENIKKTYKNPSTMDEAKEMARESAGPTTLLNCWGFTLGYYYAPKTSFAGSKSPSESFKSLVKELHRNSMELIMQFYFPPTINQGKILDILRFWIAVYHVDGFRINGFYIPYRVLLNDPLLSDTKLWFSYIPFEDLENRNEDALINLASDHGNFRYDIRKFLKGDEGMVPEFMSYQKAFPQKLALINYICDYDGFSLMDLYTYERKHNELNLENNSDGNNMNYGWNCGVEGETKKKYIQLLRKKQVKNAITLLMLCHGTPYIFSGDEFGNSRFGNNNAYCQDNETGYVKWKENSTSKELLNFTKEMISLRKREKIFHSSKELTNMDTLSVGYPDLSYHGFEAYRPDMGFNSRMLGMFFCGAYSGDTDSKSYYVGINMHWENHRLAVPKLRKQKQYKKIIDTGNQSGTSKDNEIPVGERSIVIFEA